MHNAGYKNLRVNRRQMMYHTYTIYNIHSGGVSLQLTKKKENALFFIKNPIITYI